VLEMQEKGTFCCSVLHKGRSRSAQSRRSDIETDTSEQWVESIQLNGDIVDFKLDCGADVTSIPEKQERRETAGA